MGAEMAWYIIPNSPTVESSWTLGFHKTLFLPAREIQAKIKEMIFMIMHISDRG